MHKYRPTEYTARKNAKADAKAKDAAVPNNVPALRDLVSQIMVALGMK